MGVPNFLGCRISCDTGGGTYGAGLVPRRGPGSDFLNFFIFLWRGGRGSVYTETRKSSRHALPL